MDLKSTLEKGVIDDPRSKNWEDLNYDEKFDRLAGLVTQLSNTVEIQSNIINRQNEMLMTHEHDEKGKPFTREYLDRSEKKSYPRTSLPYYNNNRNPLKVKDLSKVGVYEENVASSA